jgi:hypothetical protein
MLLSMNLGKIVVDLVWDEIRLTGDRVEWRFSAQKLTPSLRLFAP